MISRNGDMMQLVSDDKKRSLFAYCAFHFLDDGLSDALYILLPLIAAEMHFTLSEVGLMRGVFSASVSFFQLPVALLGERFGEASVIISGIVSLTGTFFILASVYSLFSFLLVLGLGRALCAGQHALSSSLLSRVFETAGRRTAMGTYNFAGDLGKVCLPFLLSILISLWGWRYATQMFAGLVMAAGVLVWFFFCKAPSKPALHTERKKSSGWGIADRRGFALLLLVGVIDYAVRVGLLTFLPFVLEEKGASIAHIGFALTLVFAGGAAGKFVCGVCAERLGIIAMIIITEAMTSLCIISTLYLSILHLWFVLPLLGIGLNGTSSVLYATVAELISPDKRARGYGLYYSVTLGAGIIAPVLFGIIGELWTLWSVVLSLSALALLTLPFVILLRRIGRHDVTAQH
jgi:MFS family permease